MRQIGQRARDGRVTVVEVPEPSVSPGFVLVGTRCSLISAGTERNKIETGSKNLLQKARARPDLARKVIDQARVQGLGPTIATVRDRLEVLGPIGYSSSGVVLALGAGVAGLAPGDRVACGGAGWANHAEVVAVPKNLVARIPDAVDFETAAYATVGSIALHGVHQAEAALGEVVGVIGLGLVGQLAVRLLRAAGCGVVGIDIDPQAVERAAFVGVPAVRRDDPALADVVRQATDGIGFDSILICAASDSTDPLRLAAELARDRGRLVIVGDIPVEVDRALLYGKELEIRLSRSYGAGRYDPDYEERGRDLPVGYVRWTEQRNLSTFLHLAAQGLDVTSLTTHRFIVEEAEEAYATLGRDDGERAFGIVLQYPPGRKRTPHVLPRPQRARVGAARVGFIGTGSFARGTLLPAFKAAGAEFVAVASAKGLTAADTAKRFDFERAEAPLALIEAGDIDAVVIATRHSSHAELTVAALRAGKAVFVEKPLALAEEELRKVEEAFLPSSVLMVGFNRRYAPHVVRLKRELEGSGGIVISVRVNAGSLPVDHWLHDVEDGGGRLAGEGCHFIDLVSDLANAHVCGVYATAVSQPERPYDCSDEVVVTLRMTDGSVGTVVYASGGDTRLPKERVEVFGGGLAAVVDDFRRLDLYRGGRHAVVKGAQNKGHRAEVRAFLDAVMGDGPAPDVSTYFNTTRATLASLASLREGVQVTL